MHRLLRQALPALLLTWRLTSALHAQATQRVDDDHGNVLPKYAAMGNPVDPTPAQVVQLNKETALGAPAQTQLHDGKLTLELSPNALLLIKVQP